jgi:diguanylate cyclase (GGDEF)-like protein
VTALSRSTRLAHARLHDALTGLPTRALFLDQAQRVLDQRRRNGFVAALFIDLDGFKPVNDLYGHATGDALLVAVAGRLSASMRRGDMASRFGGDEFLVLCTGLLEERDAMVIADRLQGVLAEPFLIGEREVSVGSSIGVATYDENTDGSSALIHNADLAMYQAKQGGRGRVERFLSSMTPAVPEVPNRSMGEPPRASAGSRSGRRRLDA